MVELERLKGMEKFLVEEWYGVYRSDGLVIEGSGHVNTTYSFRHNKGNGKLYISGGMFDNHEMQVLNADEVLLGISKEQKIENVCIMTVEGINFRLWFPKVKLQ